MSDPKDYEKNQCYDDEFYEEEFENNYETVGEYYDKISNWEFDE